MRKEITGNGEETMVDSGKFKRFLSGFKNSERIGVVVSKENVICAPGFSQALTLLKLRS